MARSAWRFCRGRRTPGVLLCAALVSLGSVAAVASAQSTPATNPELTARCGLKVMLVLDESNSIRTSNALQATRSAANGFVDALEGTGSALAITAFHSFGRRGVPNTASEPDVGYVDVTPTTKSTFQNWINGASGGYNPPTSASTSNSGPNSPNGTTNWEDAFQQVGRVPGGPPDLVVFVTDGDPNTVNDQGLQSGRRFLGTTAAAIAQAVAPAVTASNLVKGNGTRVFAIGVGAAVTSEASRARLTQVSGTRRGSNPITSDYTLVSEFEDLQTELSRLVAALCGSRLLITKYVSDPSGTTWTPTPGWRFTTTLNPTPGHTWLAPSAAGTGASASLTTQAPDGIAEFQWRLHAEEPRATLGVTREERRAGYHFVEATCQSHLIDGEVTDERNPTQIPGATLGREEYRTCQVYNAPDVGKLTVIKRLLPSGDPGRFNLLVGGTERVSNVGNNGTTGQILLRPGTVTVSETAGTDTRLADYETRIECINRADDDEVVAEVDGATSLDVPLRKNDDVVCTITNESTKFGDITVIKHLVPADAPGGFDLFIGDTRVKANARDGDRGSLTRLPFGSYSVREVVPEGGDRFDIRTVCIDQSTDPATELVDVEGPQATVTLSREHRDIQCTITNTHIPPPPRPAHLTVVKRLVPSDDAGAFDLLVDGKAWALGVRDGGRTARLAFEAPHTARVGERGAEGTDLADYEISTVCRDDGGDGRTVARGTGRRAVRVALQAGDDVVCVIENTRIAYPTVPGGGREEGTVPPDPCVDVGGCGDLAGAPNLAIGKTMPHDARVGERVPVSITVKNVGNSTARDVRLHERPPAGRPLVAVASRGSLRRDGTAAWRLGHLAPGQTRTVRLTARVTRRGLHLNRAIATASNTDPALAQATVRATGVSPSRPAPRVTG